MQKKAQIQNTKHDIQCNTQIHGRLAIQVDICTKKYKAQVQNIKHKCMFPLRQLIKVCLSLSGLCQVRSQ